MLGKSKRWPGKANHSWRRSTTVTFLSRVIITQALKNRLTKITIYWENEVMVNKLNHLPHLEFTR